jgi:mannose-6-phosphate isomerase-like protein (cupin superfamily)
MRTSVSVSDVAGAARSDRRAGHRGLLKRSVRPYKPPNSGEDVFIKQGGIDPIDFDRLAILDYTAGRDCSSSFAEITVPEGVRHKVSWSTRSDKYYYVVEGTVHFTIADEPDVLSQGDVCVVPKGIRFWYGNEGPRAAKLILVHTPAFDLASERFED